MSFLPNVPGMYNTIFNNNHTVMFLIEPDTGRILNANQAARTFYGYTNEYLISKTMSDLNAEPSGQKTSHMCLSIDAAETHCRLRHLTAGGLVRYVAIHSGPVDVDGKKVIFSVVNDITEQIHAEDKLKVSEKHYSTIVETLLEGIWILDSKGHTTFVNKQLAVMFGYTKEEMLGRHIFEFMDEAGKEIVVPKMQRRKKGQSETYDFRFCCKDNRNLWTTISTNPIFNDNGDYLGSIGLITDITLRKRSERELSQIRNNLQELVKLRTRELSSINDRLIQEIEDRKRIEEELRKSREKYRCLTEHMKDVVWTLDTETMLYNYISPSVTKLHGYTPEEIISVRADLFLSTPSQKQVFDILQNRLESFKNDRTILDHFYFHEVEMPCKDGSTVWTELITNYYLNPENGRLEVHGVTRDISERKLAEEAQRNTEKKLIKSYKRLQELTSHVHSTIENEKKAIAREIHDELGMAMTALKFDLAWIKRNFTSESVTMAERIKSMEALIHTAIQSVNRIVSELRPLILDELDFVPAIKWHAKEFEKRTGIACTLNIESDNLSVDKNITTCLFRIFQESLTNIIRHANATKVDISLFTKYGYTVLQITDNGIGIMEQEISYLSSYGIQGMRERVRLSGGDISFFGTPKKGTTVEVSIPTC